MGSSSPARLLSLVLFHFGLDCAAEDATVRLQVQHLIEPGLRETTRESLSKLYAELISHETGGLEVSSSSGVAGRATLSASTAFENTTEVTAVVALGSKTRQEVDASISTDEFTAKILGQTEAKVPADSYARVAGKAVVLAAVTLDSAAADAAAPTAAPTVFAGAVPNAAGPTAAPTVPTTTQAPSGGVPSWVILLIIIAVLFAVGICVACMLMGGEKKKKKRKKSTSKAVVSEETAPLASGETAPLVHEYAVTVSPPHATSQPMHEYAVSVSPPHVATSQPYHSGTYVVPAQTMVPPVLSGSYVNAPVQTVVPAHSYANAPVQTMVPEPYPSGTIQTNSMQMPVYTHVPQ